MRHLLTAALLTLTLALCVGHSAAQSAGDDTPRARLTVALSTLHEAPSAETLESIASSEALEDLLLDIATDPDARQLPRSRALDALAERATERTRDRLTRLLPQLTNLHLLGRALHLAGAPRLVAEAPTWSLGQLTRFASHPDPGIRRHVVLGLGRLRAHLRHEADDLLLQIALAERSRLVKRALDAVFSDDPRVLRPDRPPISRRR